MSKPPAFSLRFAHATALPALVLLVCAALAPTVAHAQDGPDDTEMAGRSRGGRAWGEEAPEGEGDGPARPPYHHYGQAFASLGVGGTVRVLAHATVCDPGQPGRESCRFSPPYLQLRGGWFFEAEGDLQHGVGLGIATNLTADGAGVGVDPLAQWTFAPSYFLRFWFDEWFQLMGHVGVPLSVAAVTGTTQSTDFNWGLELQVGLVFKFLTGLGVYAAVNGALYFAGEDMVWPTISGEVGLMFEYEVLP